MKGSTLRLNDESVDTKIHEQNAVNNAKRKSNERLHPMLYPEYIRLTEHKYVGVALGDYISRSKTLWTTVLIGFTRTIHMEQVIVADIYGLCREFICASIKLEMLKEWRVKMKIISKDAIRYVKSHRRKESLAEKLLLGPRWRDSLERQSRMETASRDCLLWSHSY